MTLVPAGWVTITTQHHVALVTGRATQHYHHNPTPCSASYRESYAFCKVTITDICALRLYTDYSHCACSNESGDEQQRKTLYMNRLHEIKVLPAYYVVSPFDCGNRWVARVLVIGIRWTWMFSHFLSMRSLGYLRLGECLLAHKELLRLLTSFVFHPAHQDSRAVLVGLPV